VTTKASSGSKKRELYDCESDPKELKDIASRESQTVNSLEDQLKMIAGGARDRDGK
jgi:hypothetical protein